MRRRMWVTAIVAALATTAVVLSGAGGAGQPSGTSAFAPRVPGAAAAAGIPAPIAAPAHLAGAPASAGPPTILHLQKSAWSFDGDVRSLPAVVPTRSRRVPVRRPQPRQRAVAL